jgi:hypothetical protein
MEAIEKGFECERIEKKIEDEMNALKNTVDRLEVRCKMRELQGYVWASEEYDAISREERKYLLELIMEKRREIINAED